MKSTLVTGVWLTAWCTLPTAIGQPMLRLSGALPWHGRNISVIASTSLWNTLSGFWTNDLPKSMFETTNEYRSRLRTMQPTQEIFVACSARPSYDADTEEFRFSKPFDQVFRPDNAPGSALHAAFIAAVQQRWYDLIDNSQVEQRSGKVVLQFRLRYDGRIAGMKVNENKVGELLCLLCQRAVLDPAPYPRWPTDMRRIVGDDSRELTCTFFYGQAALRSDNSP